MYELMIIGGGPAGLTAAVYAARKKLNAVMLSGDIGGQVNTTWGVENYMGYQFIQGPELMAKFQAQMEKFPIEQKVGYIISSLKKIMGGFEAVTEEGDKYQAKVVVYATGKSPRKLNVPGEAEFTGKGVAYCATCDGPIFSGKKVAVVGGGNSALEAALDMVKIAKHVDLVSLTPLTGDPVLIDKLSSAKKLSLFTEYQTEKIEGDKFVNGMQIKSLKGNKEQSLDVAGIFIEIGLVPNSGPVSKLVELNDNGEVMVDCGCRTSVPGIYAAGDVTSVPEKQIVIAAGEGAKAALQAHRYLQRQKPS
ncbi:NAD(P)/FAD-dependent oxidoreductase [Chloroflexota bacterium]